MRWWERKPKAAFITHEQSREINTHNRSQSDWNTFVTIPLLDDEGYPWPLRRVRRKVEARGGNIDGTSRDWIFLHPMRPSFHLRFHDDGYVSLWFPCSAFDIQVPHDLTWRLEQVWTARDDGSGTELDDAVLAVLNGGYWETLMENDNAEWKTYEWALDGGESGRAVNPDVSDHQQPVHTLVWRYPAWPFP